MARYLSQEKGRGAEGRGKRGAYQVGQGTNTCCCHFFIGQGIWHPSQLQGEVVLATSDQYRVAINNLIVWCGIIKWHPIATSCIYYPVTDVVVIGKEGFHCRKTVVRRVPRSLPSTTLRALGKQSICQVPTKKHSAKKDTRQTILFVECLEIGTRQRGVCRVPRGGHSANNPFLIFLKILKIANNV